MKNFTGRIFGRLTVERLDSMAKGRSHWVCLCECGRSLIVSGNHLQRGHTKSCGCYHLDVITKHGVSKDRARRSTLTGDAALKALAYTSWQCMRSRCNHPGHYGFHNYGGRGISVCDRWNSFLLFLEDVGLPPSLEHTIERNGNNGDYCPGNCSWATRKEQANNRRDNHPVTIDGVTRTISEWADAAGLRYHCLLSRIRHGVTGTALLQPSQYRARNGV